MSRFEVLSPGLFTTLQDMGRTAFQDQGVSPSGAMDELSFSIANALAGNPANTGALEFTLTGATLRLTGEQPCYFAVTGDMSLFLNDQSCAPYQCHIMHPGDQLRIVRVLSGARGYLAVAGGFDVQPVMGSVSTLTRAGLGGFAGRPLQKGDYLPIAAPASVPSVTGPVQRLLPQQEKRPVRIIWGPQDNYFDAEARQLFVDQKYRVSDQSDRMGYRLTGTPLTHRQGFNIISDAISHGSIQIPGNGMPIIAMNDRQTTGGYPKIATIIRADLARMGQLKPGDWLQFEAVSVEKAETLWRGRQKCLQRWLSQLRGEESNAL